MESLASKTPVIAFNVGGNCDMIKNKFNGFLIEDISSDSLRRTIEEALQVGNKEFMDNNARQYVVENFDYKVIGQKYLNLYKEILGKNNG
jgi:glycosyltransferase involved in cell wall biosynthesis